MFDGQRPLLTEREGCPLAWRYERLLEKTDAHTQFIRGNSRPLRTLALKSETSRWFLKSLTGP
jgi:hypothetical protein